MSYTLHLPEGYQKQPFPLPWDFTEWLAALRSGKYKQGKRYLKRDDAYCCLGVGCELAGMKQSGVSPIWFTFQGEESTISIPGAPMGVNDGCFPPGVWIDRDHEKIVALADGNDFGMTFEEIAEAAEQVWKP